MKKVINLYSVIYSIHLILNIVCMFLVYKYYDFIEIQRELIVYISFDLPQFISIILIELLLLIFLIISLVFLIKSINEGKKESFSKSTKLSTIILPLVFVMLLSFSFVPIGTAKYKNYLEADVSVSNVFEQLENDGESVKQYIICEKNSLGKAGYYEKICFLNGNSEDFAGNDVSDGEIDFLCSYQESDYDFINKKFERYENKDYALKHTEITDDYVLYYRQNDTDVSYALIIEDENKYFVSTYDSSDNKYINDYSKQQFVNDSLSIYSEWSSF